MIVDDWKDWRLICDNQLHLKDLYLFVEMIVDDWRDWRLICDNRLYLKDLYHFFPIFYIYQKVLKGYPVSRVKSSYKSKTTEPYRCLKVINNCDLIIVLPRCYHCLLKFPSLCQDEIILFSAQYQHKVYYCFPFVCLKNFMNLSVTDSEQCM